VSDIRASGQHLLELIADILDMTRLEIGKMDLRDEILDVGHIVQTCVSRIHPRAAGRHRRSGKHPERPSVPARRRSPSPPDPAESAVERDQVQLRWRQGDVAVRPGAATDET